MAITGEFLADFNDFVRGSREAIKEVDKLEKKGDSVGGAWASAFKNVDVKGAFADPLGEASAAAETFLQAAGPIAGVIGGLVAVAGAAAVALWNLAEGEAEAASQLGDLKVTTGISVPELSRLSMAAEVAGTDIKSLSNVVYEMNKRMAENPVGFASALDKIGISFKEFQALKPADQLLAVADGLKATTDQGARAIAGNEIMGRQYRDMAPALLNVADAAEQVAHIQPFTEADAKAAEAFKIQVAALKVEMKSFGDEIGRTAVPALTELVKWLRVGLQVGPLAQQLQEGKIAVGVFGAALDALARDSAAVTGPAIAGLADNTKSLWEQQNQAASVAPTLTAALAAEKAQAKEQADTVRAAVAEQEKFNAAMEEMNAAGAGWAGTLAGINGEMVEAIRYYLDAGVSQGALATAYGLTATEVRSVATALREEQEALKEARTLEAARTAELLSLYLEYDAAVRKSSADTTQARIDDAWRAADAQIMAMAKASTLTVEAYNVIQAKAKATAESIIRDTLAQDNQTRAHYEAIAIKAQAAYAFALQHSNEYTQARIEQLRTEAAAAEDTLTHWQAAAEQALTGVKGAAEQARDAIKSVTDEAGKATAASRGFSGMAGGATIMTDSGGVAHDLFGRPTAILPPGSVNANKSGTQIIINGHVLGTSQELAAVVGSALTAAYRQGGNRMPA